MVPKAVAFDLGKVLLDFDFAIAARALAPFCTISANELQQLIDQTPLLYRFETGKTNETEFFAEVKQLSGFRGTEADFRPRFASIFSPIPEMIDLHRRICDRSIPTYLFSNSN